jgi:hypothetical protein
MCIHQKFVNQLVETGVDWDRDGLKRIAIPKKHFVSCSLNAADVGIRESENVLAVRVLAVCICNGHDVYWGGVQGVK